VRTVPPSSLRPVRALVQRVSSASVSVADERIAAIGPGLLVLLGVARGDEEQTADRLAHRLSALRIFDDADGHMNRSVSEAEGEVLCVSQFTLLAELRSGNRPSFTGAAPPGLAEPLYERVRAALGAQGGRFGAPMAVELVNDGPVTLLVEA
jgi:D-aminoacyl-tRNA deacylase